MGGINHSCFMDFMGALLISLSPSKHHPDLEANNYFCVGSSRYFLSRKRHLHNIVLCFCLTYHPSCETIRASFICLALVQIHCPLTQSSPCAPLLLLTLLLRPGAGRDTVCFHLLLTPVTRGSAQHPAGSGFFPLHCG